VETVTRALRPHLVGRRIVRTEAHVARLRVGQPFDIGERREILGSPVVAVRRRARYCLVELANQWVIIVHLGMTGSCRLVPIGTPRQRHEHVLWELDDGVSWRFADPRRFGAILAERLPAPGADPACLGHLGPEPLSDDFTAAFLYRTSRGCRGPIKLWLMDNARVVGVGNIYASEALYRAGIRPTRPAGSLSRPRCARLVAAVREVLAEAIAAGGTTIIDFKTVDGSEGRFIRELAVYDRAGEPCRRCTGGPIRRLVQGGRSTYFCPTCQR
jgi:formamidopyrimidine-DNA glycosylase